MPLIGHGYVIEYVQMHFSELCSAPAKVLFERWQEQGKVGGAIQGCVKRGAAQSLVNVRLAADRLNSASSIFLFLYKSLYFLTQCRL
jgi:hypothetical protein